MVNLTLYYEIDFVFELRTRTVVANAFLRLMTQTALLNLPTLRETWVQLWPADPPLRESHTQISLNHEVNCGSCHLPGPESGHDQAYLAAAASVWNEPDTYRGQIIVPFHLSALLLSSLVFTSLSPVNLSYCDGKCAHP